MNLRTLGDHTVVVDLLPEAPMVLDIGCRWFDFCKQMLAIRPKARILAFDPDTDIADPDIEGVVFAHCAIVGDHRGVSNYAKFSSGEGNFLFDNLPPDRAAVIPFANWRVPDAIVTQVACKNIGELIGPWDAVKLDCEGSEFDILEHWPARFATQISVEFHDFTGPRYHASNPGYYEQLVARCLPGYRFLQHELSKKGEGCGHWDSLLVLND